MEMPLKSLRLSVAACCLAVPAMACEPAPEPIVSLDYGSRYIDDDASRSTIDVDSNEAVDNALRPIDDFLRDLVQQSNRVLRDVDDAADIADCVVDQVAQWARADALSELNSFTANLSVGARVAGFAEVYRQVRPRIVPSADSVLIEAWLAERAAQQIDFWEKGATPGARTGNLRAWAALGVLNVGVLTNDHGKRFWAYASAARILCTARPDGSLPQETKRGKYGLHYQFHAIAPLVTIAARAQMDDVDLRVACDNGLSRVIDYALSDYENGGVATEGYSGVQQSYFDGTRSLKAHELAWLAPWLMLDPGSRHAALAASIDPLSNSKLGGNQTLIWDVPIN